MTHLHVIAIHSSHALACSHASMHVPMQACMYDTSCDTMNSAADSEVYIIIKARCACAQGLQLVLILFLYACVCVSLLAP